MPPITPPGRRLAAMSEAMLLIVAIVACGGDPAATPPIRPGTPGDPRELILLAKDYAFIPAIVDLVPGEAVVLQIVNGGLVVHEVVIGGVEVQDAWEEAESAVAGAPPGATPEVSVAPALAGLRVVVQSGERVDLGWTVPEDAATEAGGWQVGCHIPGHWAEGMVVPVRFVGVDGRPIPTPAPAATPAATPTPAPSG